jgi:hypothetical protein
MSNRTTVSEHYYGSINTSGTDVEDADITISRTSKVWIGIVGEEGNGEDVGFYGLKCLLKVPRSDLDVDGALVGTKDEVPLRVRRGCRGPD